ncbi:ABC transporter ATP-binding protein [uncultured Roseobacter sp.]|uniref:ABC transporter ATP-binding protein n=1 Tax=uncultured Roseobacter sp. TaxID=114847 RepID=UPI002631EDD6|nr:ABC transporter ATP-binding protein [uncultured Roseobacter sp.]
MKISLENVSFKYGKGLAVLDDVSMTIDAPGIYGVVGANGAGKSTFFDLLMGFRQPDSGEIVFDGIEKKSMLLQKTTFSNLLTLRENLKLVSAVRGYSIVDKVERYLREDGRADLITRRYGVLSGGEKRWFAVQCIIQGQADFYIYDEPTIEIDQEYRSKIWNEIVGSQSNNIVFVSGHHHDEIAAVARGMIQIDKGNVSFLANTGTTVSVR